MQRVAYEIGLLSRPLQVEPHLGFFGLFHGALFLSVGLAECCVVAPESQSGGLVGQECEDRSLKTQLGLC